jgi:MFS family permease
MTVDKMLATERRVALTLAGVFSMRMFGLFLVLPVISVLAYQYPDASPTLVGFAIGAYGLTQALLQIPFGVLSDRFGRKPIIYFGLCLFFVGSMVAGISESFIGVVLGRAIQGSGAIGAVIMALVADNIREQHRSKGMAMVGMSIGLAFAAALVCGPLISQQYGLSGLFYVTASLTLVSALLISRVPEKSQIDTTKTAWYQVLSNHNLLVLNASIFSLHFMLSAFFLMVPQQIESLGFALNQQAFIYLPVLLISVIIMVPCMIATERRKSHKLSLSLACLMLIIVSASTVLNLSSAGLFIIMTLFFSAFNLVEALLPSLVSRVAPDINRGSAMGVYSTFQFSGIFLGGAASGVISDYFGTMGVASLCVLTLSAWLFILQRFNWRAN